MAASCSVFASQSSARHIIHPVSLDSVARSIHDVAIVVDSLRNLSAEERVRRHCLGCLKQPKLLRRP